MAMSRVQQVVDLERHKGLLRPRDLAEAGIARQYLHIAHKRGLIERVGRGLYRVPGELVSPRISLAEVCKRASGGVIYIDFRFSFHGLTTQIPSIVYLAIPEKAHIPRTETVQVHTVCFSGPAFT